jgi:hypothetical protein
MIPEDLLRKQAQNATQAPAGWSRPSEALGLAAAGVSANDPPDGPAPERCAACGRPYELFDLPASRLLDLVCVAKDALTDLQAALEAEVLP